MERGFLCGVRLVLRFRKVDDDLSLLFCKLYKLMRSAEGVLYVTNHYVCALKKPTVAVLNGEAGRYGFDTLRKNCVFPILPVIGSCGEGGKHDGILNLGMKVL